jgi:hypothetical protein
VPSSLTTVNITDDYDIGTNCFRYANIQIISMPFVKNIGSQAFYNCISLNSIITPDSVINIGGLAFYNTLWYNNQPDGVVYVNKALYSYKGTMPINTNIDIEDGTFSITESAFAGCTDLSSIAIPNSVTNI